MKLKYPEGDESPRYKRDETSHMCSSKATRFQYCTDPPIIAPASAEDLSVWYLVGPLRGLHLDQGIQQFKSVLRNRPINAGGCESD